MWHPRYVDLMNEASQCVVLSTGAKPYDIVLLHGARKVCSCAVLKQTPSHFTIISPSTHHHNLSLKPT